MRIKPGQEHATKAVSSVDGDENPAMLPVPPIVEDATPPVTLRPRPWTVLITVTFLKFSAKEEITRKMFDENHVNERLAMQTMGYAFSASFCLM